MTVVWSFLRGAWKVICALLGTTPGAAIALFLIVVLGCGALFDRCYAKGVERDLATCRVQATATHEADLVNLTEERTGRERERQEYGSLINEQNGAIERLHFEGELSEQAAKIAQERATQVQVVTQTRIETVYRDRLPPDATCPQALDRIRKELLDFAGRWNGGAP